MKKLIPLLLIFVCCSKDKEPSSINVTIECSRAFPVSLNGAPEGHCGGSLTLVVNKGGVIEVVPDVRFFNPDGSPTGKTSSGTADITYNGRTSSKFISGNGEQVIINW